MARPREASKGAGTLVLVNTTSFSSVGSININNCFSSLYSNYKVITNLRTSTTASVFARMRASGVDVSANYRNQRLWSYGTTTGSSSSTNDTGINGNYNVQPLTEYGEFNMDIYSPYLVERTRVLSIWTCTDASETNFINSVLANTSQYDGISFITSTGTITGTVRVYGYRN